MNDTKLKLLNRLITFTLAFFQVFFVSINVYFISRVYYTGIVVASFAINVLWMYNVNGMAKKKSWLYPLGATFGCVAGLKLGEFLIG